MNRKRCRAMRRFKWVLTVATSVILLVWIGSERWYWGFNTRYFGLLLHEGGMRVSWEAKSPGAWGWGFAIDWDSKQAPRWMHTYRGRAADMMCTSCADGHYDTYIPFQRHKRANLAWIWPFMAALTAMLWLKDRRVRWPYCPSCRYNLTGNVSGICSECGTPVPE